MMMRILNLFVLVCSIWASASLASVTTEEFLPESVLSAITSGYDIGRIKHDAGGISNVRAFNIAFADQESFPGLLAGIIHMTDSRHVKPVDSGSMASWCTADIELANGAPTLDPMACAKFILANMKSSGELEAIAEMSKAGRDADADEKTFAAANAKIHAFVKSAVGEDYQEFAVTQKIFSVDVTTTVLINKDLTKVIVMTRDFGA